LNFRVLILSENQIGDVGARAIGMAIRERKYMKKMQLSLCTNSITSAGAESIRMSMERLPGSELIVDLSYNFIEEVDRYKNVKGIIIDNGDADRDVDEPLRDTLNYFKISGLARFFVREKLFEATAIPARFLQTFGFSHQEIDIFKEELERNIQRN